MALPSRPFPYFTTAWQSIWSLVQHNHSHRSGWHLEVRDKHRCSLTAEHLGKERGMTGTCWVYPTCAVIFEHHCAIWLGLTGNPKDKWEVWVHFVLKPLLLCQPTHYRVSPSWWAWCDRGGSLAICVVHVSQAGFPAHAVHGMGFPRHKHGSPGTCSGAVWQGCGCGTSPYGAQLCLSLKGVT